MELTEAQQRDVIRARQVLAEVDEASKNGDLYEHEGVMARAIGRLEIAVEYLLLIADPDGETKLP